ncbi:Spo0E like sporulation regulatory protein [Oxobacter pfennigii]|uniref:Spo0E like sporulation regulatory protein n=1 Tax=Oxobacter pfennigii TaxID=36849 RepID=A0A0P8YZ49_9CLOT|nr:aspartyl-phosphate phosphatase Spo0E family protein [Oxobacter pfennigii]KPU45111.1 Spo0E like sporulation regulatory protein [Oxobacter pfennigii]
MNLDALNFTFLEICGRILKGFTMTMRKEGCCVESKRIYSRIEIVKSYLCSLILDDSDLLNPDVIFVSKELDKMLNKYYAIQANKM